MTVSLFMGYNIFSPIRQRNVNFFRVYDKVDLEVFSFFTDRRPWTYIMCMPLAAQYVNKW